MNDKPNSLLSVRRIMCRRLARGSCRPIYLC